MVEQSPNVLLLTVDSLRRDYVNSDTMPYLDKLRREGLEFTAAQSCAPATMASFVGTLASRYFSDISGIGLPNSEFSTLAEAVPDEYQTIGITANSLTGTFYNYDRGFNYFSGPNEGPIFEFRKRLGLTELGMKEDNIALDTIKYIYNKYLSIANSTAHTRAEEIHSNLLNTLSSCDEPWLSWIHYMEPHHPYEPPKEFLPDQIESQTEAREISDSYLHGRMIGEDEDSDYIKSTISSLYQGECEYLDSCIKNLHSQLPQNTWIIILGDHGEMLGEYERIGHLHEMWNELINVPLIFYHPSITSEEYSGQQSLLDISPTILNLLDARIPADMRGEPIDIFDPTPRDYTYGTIQSVDNVGFIRDGEHKWVLHNSRRSSEPEMGENLFKIPHEGPSEGIADQSEAERLKRKYFKEMSSDSSASAVSQSDERLKKHLSDLGYLDQE